MTRSLTALLLLCLLLPAAALAAQPVNTSEAQKLLAAPPADLIILDVRTPKEFAAGHLPGAVNMDIFDQQFVLKLRELDPQKTYLVYCRTDSRSGQAVELMDDASFAKVYWLKSGISGWQREQFPLDK